MIYCAAYSSSVAAGPVVAVAAYFKSEAPKARPTFGSTSMQQLKAYIESAEQNVDYEYVLIPNHKINYLGYNRAVSTTIEYLSAKFGVRYNVKSPTIIPPKHCVGALGSPFTKVTSSNIKHWDKSVYTFSLARYYSAFWMSKYYHYFHPIYRWNKNYGFSRPNHLDVILEHGPVPELHRRRILLRLCLRWYDRVIQGDRWARSHNWLTRQPVWWTELFPKVHFCSKLSKTQLNRLKDIYYPSLDEEFVKWIQDTSEHAVDAEKTQDNELLCYRPFAPGEFSELDIEAAARDLKQRIKIRV